MNIAACFTVLLFAFSCASNGSKVQSSAKDSSYTLNGDVSGVFLNGNVTLYAQGAATQPDSKPKVYSTTPAGPSAGTSDTKNAPAKAPVEKGQVEMKLNPNTGKWEPVAKETQPQAPIGENNGKKVVKATTANSGAANVPPPTRPKDPRTPYAESKITGGKFSIEGKLNKPTVVEYVMTNADNKHLINDYVMGRSVFILEPGELTFTMSKFPGVFTIQGGDKKLNDLILGYRNLPEYEKATADFFALFPKNAQPGRKGVDEKAAALQKTMMEIEMKYREEVATSSKDVETLLLLLETGKLRSNWSVKAVEALSTLAPEDPRVKALMAKEAQIKEAMAQANVRYVGVGTDIKYFMSQDLEGNVVSLRDMIQKTKAKYVLLEFWASWCAPCRGEMPNMKAAYEKYGPKGFEIFSYTVDEKKEDWVKASKEDGIPWTNSGYGPDEGPRELYNVTGYPTNFLLDVESGKIIEMNLRGENLHEKLKELLG